MSKTQILKLKDQIQHVGKCLIRIINLTANIIQGISKEKKTVMMVYGHVVELLV